MSASVVDWPVKKRELENTLFDSTRWNDIEFRDGDVVVATWAKTGTTWTQQIVWQLLRGAPPGAFSTTECPWVDMRLPDRDEMLATLKGQTQRRSLKTHLPLDAIVFSPEAKYIYVARDARDVIWSAHNHQAGFTDFAFLATNHPDGPAGDAMDRPSMDVREYYLYWLETDEAPGFLMPSYWDHVQGWWNARHLPNVLMVHYANLKADLRGEIERIAQFIDVEVDEATWQLILEHCSFDYMQKAAVGDQLIDTLFKDGAKTFFNRGTNGRWREVLTPEEIARCDEVAARRLTPDCAHWLATGELSDG